MSGETQTRTLALIIGPGRSGTSLLAGICSELGFQVPQPEVKPNRTNPRGFGEPRWVVDFHARLMARRNVSLFDARPVAWRHASQIAGRDGPRETLRAWLEAEFTGSPRVVVKDPRTVWFLKLWQAVAQDLDARVHCLAPLRHPTEVLHSVRTTAGRKQPEASRAAWWVSTMLQTEFATRGAARAYVLFDDLVTDWRAALASMERQARLSLISGATEERLAGVEAFVDPGLRRSVHGWDELDVPPRLRDLADDVWRVIARGAGEADASEWQLELDALRARYLELYGEAEAITHESIRAASAAKAKVNAKTKDAANAQKWKKATRPLARLRRLAGGE